MALAKWSRISLVLSLGLLSCGEPQTTSQEKSITTDKGTPVMVKADSQFRVYNDETIDKDDLIKMAKQELAITLREYGAIPSMVQEQILFALSLEDLKGCSDYGYCSGSFNFNVKLSLSKEDITFDEIQRRVSFDEVKRESFRKKLRWVIKALVRTLFDNGSLASVGIETPYY